MSAPPALPVPARLLERARNTPDASLCVVPERALPGGRPVKGHPGWWRITVGQAALQLAQVADALEAMGVTAGARVAVLANASHTWAVVDLAIQALGAVTVGLSKDLHPDELRRRVALTQPRLLVTDQPVDVDLPQVAMPGSPGPQLPEPPTPSLAGLAERLSRVSPEQPATLAFTAGTTRCARAAVLTHMALHQAVKAGRTAFGAGQGDRSVVALPMDHIHQRFATYAGTDRGIEGWYPRGVEHLPETFRAARPTLLVASPVVLEDIQVAARTRAVERGFGSLYDWACRQRQGRTGWRARAERELADHMVFRRIRRGLGGQLRTIVAGGAPLERELAAWFQRIGVPVRNGWGLVETGAPLTASPPIGVPGSVGRPLPGVQLRTSVTGELHVRSPTLMDRYHDDPQATADAFTEDGWLRTGDLGTVDAAGWVHLHGRVTNRVAGPQGIDLDQIDAQLRAPGGRTTVTCRAQDGPGLTTFAFRRHSGASVPSPIVLRQRIQAWNAGRPPEQTIHGLAIVDHPLTAMSGTCTPTRAPVRREIRVRYQDEVRPL